VATTTTEMESLHWVGLTLALATVSLGISGFLQLLGALLAFLAGGLLLWYGVAASRACFRTATTFDKISRGRIGSIGGHTLATMHQQQGGRASLLSCQLPDTSGRCDSMTVLAGSSQIDSPLNEIIAYVFRDYVFSWHFKLTHSHTFPAEAEDSLHRLVASLAGKIQEVDWIPFLTTSLVDDVASHVKLFKKARLALKAKSKDDSGKLVELESLFFDAEVAMEGNVCRDLVSTIQQEEHNYLQNVSEILLFLLMPEIDFSASPLRVLLREIVANSILKPTLDLLSDPDFINQTLVWLYSDYKIKPDIFSNSIRCSENIDELSATRDLVSEEIAYLRSNDSRSEMDSTLKQQLNSLLYIRKVITNRIHAVESGLADDADALMGAAAAGLLFLPGSQIDWNQMIEPGKMRLFQLPLEVMLKNNVAISYFIDYMTAIGCQSYIFFYLNIEGWKVSAEQQLQAIELDTIMRESGQESKMSEGHRSSLQENMREAAHSIYEEYLSDKANPRLKIDESVVKRLLFKIRTEPPNSDWFDEVQESVHSKLANEERFLESFRLSYGYVKLLRELDLLKDNRMDGGGGGSGGGMNGSGNGGTGGGGNGEDDVGSEMATDELSIYDSLSLNSYDSANFSEDRISTGGGGGGSGGAHDRRSSSSEDARRIGGTCADDSSLTSSTATASVSLKQQLRHRRTGSNVSEASLNAAAAANAYKRHRRTGSNISTASAAESCIEAQVVDVQIVKDKKSYALYDILVKIRSNDDKAGEEEERHVYRRYSDFFALHERVCAKFPHLSKLPFPSKKTFGNMDSSVIQKRRVMLDAFIKELLVPTTLQENEGLVILVDRFLDNECGYEKERLQSANNVLRAVGSVKNSVKNVTSAVTSVPNNLMSSMDNAIARALNAKQAGGGGLAGGGLAGAAAAAGGAAALINDEKVGAGIDAETSDNIPLRILLLFMDEVFDLQDRNQWLRRQIVAVLRQLIKAMFGDIVNRRIVDYFAQVTSPEKIGSYLDTFKQSFWPDGHPAAANPQRDENTKMRTRVAARAALFSTFSDDLRRVVGSETSRNGLLMIFDMLQHPVLNKRLGIVILEGVLKTLFQNQEFASIFQKLHSRSSRVRNELKNAQRTFSDIGLSQI